MDNSTIVSFHNYNFTDIEKIVVGAIGICFVIVCLLISIAFWIIKRMRNSGKRLLSNKEILSSSTSRNDEISNNERMNSKKEESKHNRSDIEQNYAEFKDIKPSNIVVIIK